MTRVYATRVVRLEGQSAGATGSQGYESCSWEVDCSGLVLLLSSRFSSNENRATDSLQNSLQVLLVGFLGKTPVTGVSYKLANWSHTLFHLINLLENIP